MTFNDGNGTIISDSAIVGVTKSYEDSYYVVLIIHLAYRQVKIYYNKASAQGCVKVSNDHTAFLADYKRVAALLK